MRKFSHQLVWDMLKSLQNWVALCWRHGHLITKVLHRKETYRTYIGVDASAANLMRPAFTELIITSQM